MVEVSTQCRSSMLFQDNCILQTTWSFMDKNCAINSKLAWVCLWDKMFSSRCRSGMGGGQKVVADSGGSRGQQPHIPIFHRLHLECLMKTYLLSFSLMNESIALPFSEPYRSAPDFTWHCSLRSHPDCSHKLFSLFACTTDHKPRTVYTGQSVEHSNRCLEEIYCHLSRTRLDCKKKKKTAIFRKIALWKVNEP